MGSISEVPQFDSASALQPDRGFDKSKLQGKSVIITGGASGMGEAAVRGFVDAGAIVTFLDRSPENGKRLSAELGADRAIFVHGDVTKWSDQVAMFKTAIQHSPSSKIDVVVANAGFGYPTPTQSPQEFMVDVPGKDGEALEPDLNIININLVGAIYTWKLALHQFTTQRAAEGENPTGDYSMIFTSSLAAYIDHPFGPAYASTKWGLRGLMRCLRTMTPYNGIRVNIISPGLTDTGLVGKENKVAMLQQKLAFADPKDAGVAMMHIAADSSINGRSIAVVPRISAPLGYMDLCRDHRDLDDWVWGMKTE